MVDPDSDVGSTWRSFCGRLGNLGDRLTLDPFPESGRDLALDVRHLARQLVMAVQAEIEFGDAGDPMFHRYEEPWVQWGGPNPDNVYTRAAIDPAATYRVSGSVAGVRSILFSLVDGDMHLGRYGVFSECTLADLHVGADGTIELWIGPERDGPNHDHPNRSEQNWITSHPEARLFLVRQYLCDWEHDRAATLTIERIDAPGPGPRPQTLPMPSPQMLSSALDRAATWIERSIEYWCVYVERARETLPRNALGPPSTPRGGAPTIAYGAGWWELDRDQALLITTDVPDADYWGWTVHHRFRLDSGDFANRQTSVNMMQAFADDDGQLRLVVAHADPGVPNWIDTESQPEGMLVYRSIGTRSRPTPQARVVPLAEVRAHLPENHPRVDETERREQLARRRAAVLARYV